MRADFLVLPFEKRTKSPPDGVPVHAVRRACGCGKPTPKSDFVGLVGFFLTALWDYVTGRVFYFPFLCNIPVIYFKKSVAHAYHVYKHFLAL